MKMMRFAKDGQESGGEDKVKCRVRYFQFVKLLNLSGSEGWRRARERKKLGRGRAPFHQEKRLLQGGGGQIMKPKENR